MNISNKLAQSICKWLNVNSSINRYALKSHYAVKYRFSLYEQLI